ncbi:MAG TPA: PhoH family protein [Armatimonadota bacterium]|mgnify:CR=1 FL=1|nr:PhoH family protein [Armatimonadota bacterium]
MGEDAHQTVIAADAAEAAALVGEGDAHLVALREILGVKIIGRGSAVEVAGEADPVAWAAQVLQSALEAIRQGHPVTTADLQYAAGRARAGRPIDLAGLLADTIVRGDRGRQIRPRTAGQRAYVSAMRAADLTFGIGPAGTGKTYLAVALAIAELKAQVRERIILTRPAVEAGEHLGFLPGDLTEKVDPYLRPLHDALYDMVGVERARRLAERGTIEVVPLAYMRGRTLNNAFVILDEAQNTTVRQMQMFLTRMGFSSKIVVTGDVTQTDLPEGQESGLVHAEGILQGIEGIRIVHLTDEDVVRHPLVRRVIRAYDEAAAGRRSVGPETDGPAETVGRPEP